MPRFHTPDDSIEVVAHSPAWAREFEETRAEILAAVPGVAVEHIGSTSVPGLWAKPTIDVLVAFDPGTDLDPIIRGLEGTGFEFRPAAFSDHLYFRKVGPDRKRSHHVHVVEAGSTLASDYLAFRDYLRARADAREVYQAAKLRLIGAGKTRAEYVAEKAEVVAGLLYQARRWSGSRSPGVQP